MTGQGTRADDGSAEGVGVKPAPVLIIPGGIEQQDEVLGTKPKFWFWDPSLGRALFKWSDRPGEDWAEWLASQLAMRLDIDAARVELAEHGERRGIISSSFLEPGDELFHGNELLSAVVPDYPAQQIRRVTSYTVCACLDAVSGIAGAREQLVGYLMFDAFVANTDRHHENWAVVRRGSAVRLAPTYDHAASFGYNHPDVKVARCLDPKDANSSIEKYSARARSAFHPEDGGSERPIHPRDAFEVAAAIEPEAARRWLSRLAAVSDAEVGALIARIPEDRISAVKRTFVASLLAWNRSCLLSSPRAAPSSRVDAEGGRCSS